MFIIYLKPSNITCLENDLVLKNKNTKTINIDYEFIQPSDLSQCDILIIHTHNENTLFGLLTTIKQSQIEQPTILVLHPDSSLELKIKTLGATFFINCQLEKKVINTIIQLLEQKKPSRTRQLKYKDIILDLDKHKVIRGKNSHRLPNKEFELLKYFLNNPQRLIKKQELMESLWDFNKDINTTTIEAHICKLRKKIDIKNFEKRLHTIAYSGYIFE